MAENYNDPYSPEARVAWDQTFAPSTDALPPSPGSFALRARQGVNRMDLAEKLHGEQEQALNFELNHNQTAQNLYFRNQDLQRRAEAAKAAEARNVRLDAAKAELQQHQIAAQDAAAQAHIARQKADLASQAAQLQVQTHSDNVRAAVAQALPTSTPDQLDQVMHNAATQNPAALHDKDIGPQILQARKNIAQRQRQATMDAQAATLGMVPNQITAGGDLTYHNPAPITPGQKSAKPPLHSDPEMNDILTKYEGALSLMKKEPKDVQEQYTPGLNAMRAKINERQAVLDKQDLAKQALADPSASEAHKAAAKQILGPP